MASAGEVWFDGAGRRLFARAWGSGDPLVLVHGSHLNSQSFGSGITLAAALRNPQRVRALVLAQPAYAGAEIGHTEAQRDVWVRAEALVEEAARDGLEAALLRSQTDEAGRAWVREAVVEQRDERSFLAAHRGEMGTVQPFDGVAELRTITVPVLLVAGSDPAHDPAITDLYAQHLPHSVRAQSSGNDPRTWIADLLDFAPLVARGPRPRQSQRRTRRR